MKKSLLLIAAIAISMLAKAWEVGDYYDLDGVPSIIVWVDSTGEHGLRMSAQMDFCENYWYKQDVKSITKILDLEAKGKQLNQKQTIIKLRWQSQERYLKVSEWQKAHAFEIPKTKKTIDITPLLASNSDLGEINMKAILQFCEDNNYDMQTYFPAFYWATTIGDKWFIPGAYEADLISKMRTEGLGKEQDFKTTNERDLEFIQKIGLYLYSNMDKTSAFDWKSNILTSTMILSDWTKDKDNFDKLMFLATTAPTMSGERYESQNERIAEFNKLMHNYLGNQTTVFLALYRYTVFKGMSAQDYYYLYENIYEKYTGYDYTKFDGTAKFAVCYF